MSTLQNLCDEFNDLIENNGDLIEELECAHDTIDHLRTVIKQLRAEIAKGPDPVIAIDGVPIVNEPVYVATTIIEQVG